MILVLLLWSSRYAHVRRLFRCVVAAVLLWEAFPALSVYADTIIVPGAFVRPRYDSNVFRRPTQLLPPGTQPEDFITGVGGGLELIHTTRDIEADVTMGGSFNALMVNSDRNFFAALVHGTVRVDHWIDRYARGAKLSVTENLRYSPELPAFLAGARDLPEDDSLIRGTQGFRANTLYSTTNATGAYSLSRDLSVEGGYILGYRRIGQIQGGDQPGGQLLDIAYFNSLVNTWYGGPRYQLTRNDSVAVLYRQSFLTQERSQGGRTFNTNLITLWGDYSKTFQEWDASIRGGVTLVEPFRDVFATGIFQVNTRPERDTAVRFAVSREPKPSFFLQGGAIISNIARLGISYTIYERLILDSSIAYAYNQFVPDTPQTFQNLTATTRLIYKLTRNLDSQIFYLYQNVDSDTSAAKYQWSRNEVGIMLTTEWR